MKSFAIVNKRCAIPECFNPCSGVDGQTGSFKHEIGPVWQSFSDSAITPAKRPFFVPDFDSEFVARPALGIRIDRLGKSVTTKFASRYWTQFCGVVNFCATNLQKRLSDMGLPADKAFSFDRSLFIGDFITSDFLNSNSTLHLFLNSDDVMQWRIELLLDSINESIAVISEDNTIKNGDIIIPALPLSGPKVVPGDKLSLKLDDNPIITINIR